MSSGFRMRSSRGVMWRIISRCSRVFEFWMEVRCVGRMPRWVMSNMDRVYAAVSNIAMPVKISVRFDQLNRVVMIISSAIRFVVGGSAMLVKLANSHQVAMRGRMGCRPRVSRRMRLCVRS